MPWDDSEDVEGSLALQRFDLVSGGATLDLGCDIHAVYTYRANTLRIEFFASDDTVSNQRIWRYTLTRFPFSNWSLISARPTATCSHLWVFGDFGGSSGRNFSRLFLNSTGLSNSRSADITNYFTDGALPYWIYEVAGSNIQIEITRVNWFGVRNSAAGVNSSYYWNLVSDFEISGRSETWPDEVWTMRLLGVEAQAQNLFLYPSTTLTTADRMPPFDLWDFVLDTDERHQPIGSTEWCPEDFRNGFYNFQTTNDGQGGSDDEAQKFWSYCLRDNFNWLGRSEFDPVAVLTEFVVWTGDLRLIVSGEPDVDLIRLNSNQYGIALATLILTGDNDDNPCDQTGVARFWEGTVPSWFQIFKDNEWQMSIPAPTSPTYARWTSNNSGDNSRAQGIPLSTGNLVHTTNNDVYLCLVASASGTTDWLSQYNDGDRISILPTTSAADPNSLFDNLRPQYQRALVDVIDINDDLTAQERLAGCPSSFATDVTGDRNAWSWIGRWFTDPVDNTSQLAKAIVSGVSCVGTNLFVPSASELGDILSESDACSERVGSDYGETYETYLVEGEPACRIDDLWATIYSDISTASEGPWPRCKQPIVDFTGLSELELVENILDTNEDGTIQNSEGEDFDSIEESLAVDACDDADGEPSLLKSASTVIKPLSTVGLLIFCLWLLPKLIFYGLTRETGGPRL